MNDPFNEVVELETLDTDIFQSDQISSKNLISSIESVVNLFVNQNCAKISLSLFGGNFFKYDSSFSDNESILMTCVKCEPEVVKTCIMIWCYCSPGINVVS